MRIFRVIRIFGALMMFGALFMIGHSYHKTMVAPAGSGPNARFVSSNNGLEINRTGVGQPTMTDSIKLMWAGLVGKEPERKNDLRELHARTALSRAPAPGSVEAATREIDFWTDFTARLGFTGP
ncbi:hypothetical protein [Litoreibacter albidus]|uniref:Uncharacterized protein n=1 Tax=Litoreibacter albidus TaxID=670155 RepID=A0A1H3D4F1_9RHOB|nr:hypothetical protein [Litoreibacter albidus]SDX61257.1 hypothetical protein SAMN04488001_0021 [Litoreibacter albidus]